VVKIEHLAAQAKDGKAGHLGSGSEGPAEALQTFSEGARAGHLHQASRIVSPNPALQSPADAPVETPTAASR
jgi:hypothetical protein